MAPAMFFPADPAMGVSRDVGTRQDFLDTHYSPPFRLLVSLLVCFHIIRVIAGQVSLAGDMEGLFARSALFTRLSWGCPGGIHRAQYPTPH